jgi:DNA-binding transcriptional LysR family regulator
MSTSPPSSHGETLLSYAHKLLALDNEARARLRSGEVSGRVVLGCPDLYAAFLLPRILARFAISPACGPTLLDGRSAGIPV